MTVEEAAEASRKEVQKSGESYDFWAKNGMSFAKNGDTNIAYKHGFIKGAEYAALKTSSLQAALDDKEKEIERLRSDVIEVMKYMCGHTNFPPRPDNKGIYYWRTIMREKFKEIGIEIPKQP